MMIKLTVKYIIAFLALTFLLCEVHEIAHTTVGRLLCGCWGQRDFNVWRLCEGCAERNPLAILATFAGPLFSFSVLWMGAFWIGKNSSPRQKAMGFSLIFASTPFGRILTALTGGGDEVWGLSNLLENHGVAWIIGLLLVLAITIVPLVRAFRLLENKRRTGWFLLFFLAPTIINIIVVMGILNFLVAGVVQLDYTILGSPIIVTLWTILVTCLFLLTRKNIFALTDSGPAAHG